jgi:trans-aconitate 2-methyltransferase
MAAWDPAQYHKFQAERFLPFEDCLRLIEKRKGLRVIDLGCGTGELTARLQDFLPGSDVLGIDSSAEMLKKAVPRASLRFERRRIEDTEGKWDLVFSHAAIQWIDDHARLIPQMLRLVAPGGQLVVQMPSNHDHPAYAAVRELASDARISPVLPLPQYAELLHAHGGHELVVFEKVYPHILPDADAVVEWMRGTVMLPLEQRLGEGYVAKVRDRVRQLMPGSPVFFGFRRILFSARVQ